MAEGSADSIHHYQKHNLIIRQNECLPHLMGLVTKQPRTSVAPYQGTCRGDPLK